MVMKVPEIESPDEDDAAPAGDWDNYSWFPDADAQWGSRGWPGPTDVDIEVNHFEETVIYDACEP